MISIFSIVIVIIILWSVWGLFSSRVEQTNYRVITIAKQYEVRAYPEHIVAQTTLQGTYNECLNQGFRIIAGYIFGDNTKKENIAMTAPVLATTQGETHTVSFGMPASYTLDTLPQPNDSRVKIITVPAKKYASIKFSWWRTEKRVKAMERKLLDSLSYDKVDTIGTPVYAGYTAPWTPPWMTRNEVMVEI